MLDVVVVIVAELVVVIFVGMVVDVVPMMNVAVALSL